MTRSRNWVFTLNNPVPGFDSPWKQKPEVLFFVHQLEIAPGTGTEHAQGYIHLGQSRTLAWVKANLNETAHWEIRRGSHQQAFDYCTKAESRKPGAEPVVHGEPPAQGARADLALLQKDLDDGLDLTEVASSHFSAFMRYHKGIMLYRALKSTSRNWQTYTTVYYGDSGTGKSYRASFEAGPEAYYLPAPNSASGAVWWDGYTGQENVVIDEFYGWIAHSFMLRLCDRLPLTVQTKGGNIPFLARNIYITSNKAPTEWWPRTGLGAMERRLTGDMGKVIHMSFGPGGAHWKPPALPQPPQGEGNGDNE